MWLDPEGLDAAEADFQRFYGLDLSVELHRLCVRRLWVLLYHMPRDGAWGELMLERHKNDASRVTSVDQLTAFLGGMG